MPGSWWEEKGTFLSGSGEFYTETFFTVCVSGKSVDLTFDSAKIELMPTQLIDQCDKILSLTHPGYG